MDPTPEVLAIPTPEPATLETLEALQNKLSSMAHPIFSSGINTYNYFTEKSEDHERMNISVKRDVENGIHFEMVSDIKNEKGEDYILQRNFDLHGEANVFLFIDRLPRTDDEREVEYELEDNVEEEVRKSPKLSVAIKKEKKLNIEIERLCVLSEGYAQQVLEILQQAKPTNPKT